MPDKMIIGVTVIRRVDAKLADKEIFILFTQYFKRMTHLAKISHSTKWPSTNILNSLKTHVIEKSKNIIYTYIWTGNRSLISH